MIPSSFIDPPKTSVTSTQQFWLMGLPIVAGVSALIMSLFGTVVTINDSPEAQISNLTDQNHMLMALTCVTSVFVILLALYNKRTMK